jgi:predicted acetyltransferase
MADIEVRAVEEGEIADYLRCVRTAFFDPAPIDESAVGFWTEWWDNDLSRRLAGVVDGTIAGTAGAFATELTVPGGAPVPLCAVTGVTVLPTHRRRGILRQMMQQQLADAVDREEVAAMLIAAEWPIYGRYGYGMAIEAAQTTLDARAARFLPAPGREPSGEVELVDPVALRELGPPVFDVHRGQVAGPIARGSMTWDLMLGLRTRPGHDAPKGRVAVVHRAPDGTIDGYALYHAHDTWVDNSPRVEVVVDELITTNDHAYRDLWVYLASIDWVTTVKAGVRPTDEPLRLLLEDGRAAVQRDRSDHMWVRILDVRRALEARRYETSVAMVVEVHDQQLGLGGRFELDGGPDGATATPTARDADVALEIDALGGAYMGGTPLWWFAQAGKVDEHTPGALVRLDAALRTTHAPWCTTNF